MAFKSLSNYNKEKYGNFFVLPNDGDSAQVMILYKSIDDVAVGDVHYIKSADYSGYVECLGSGCPACAYRSSRGGKIQLQTQMFIPLYIVSGEDQGKIKFWDRTIYFEPVLHDVFAKYPNPSEYVFEITRHGKARSKDTTYSITAVDKATGLTMDSILEGAHISFPEGYSRVCKSATAQEINDMLNPQSSVPTQDYGYIPTPRVDSDVEVPQIPVPPVSGAELPESNEALESLEVADLGDINDPVDINDSDDSIDNPDF